MITIIAIGRERWYVIEDIRVMLKRWLKAWKHKRFMFVRYAGVNYYLNPFQIRYMHGQT
jgi:hypothetical protein